MSDRRSQLDLLEWTAPEPVARFDIARVRAASINGQIKRAIAEALRGRDREVVARNMSQLLGEKISVNMLNAYASEAREDHAIPLVRFAALLQAVGDARLLNVLAEPCGWAVVPEKYVPLIQLGALRDHEDVVRRRRRQLTDEAKAKGAL
jgi:hypothetical protein